MRAPLLLSIGLLLLPALAAPAGPPAAPAPTGKPWLDDPAAFINRAPGRQFIIGRSGAVCLTPAEASERACLDAAVQIVERLRPRLRARRLAGEEHARLVTAISGDLLAGRCISDRHTQRQAKAYGELWSQAVLIDLDKNELDSLTRRCDDLLMQRQQTFLGAGGSIAMLAGVIFLTYVLMNTLTRGYARGRLRAAAALLLAAGAGIMIWAACRVS